MPNVSTRPNTRRSTEFDGAPRFGLDARSHLMFSLVTAGWMVLGGHPTLFARIDGRRDLVEVRDVGGRRTVLIPRMRLVHFMRLQSGKDWSASVCERVCVAAYRRPRLLRCEEVH